VRNSAAGRARKAGRVLVAVGGRGSSPPPPPPRPGVLTRTAAGLIRTDEFADLSNWTAGGASEWSILTSQPQYTYHPHDRLLCDLQVSGSWTSTIREPYWFEDAAGREGVYFHGGDGSASWGNGGVLTTADGWVTHTFAGRLPLPAVGYAAQQVYSQFEHTDGKVYAYAITTPSVDSFGVPQQPYGNHLFRTADPFDLATPWESVSDNDPALGGGGSGQDGENGPVSTVLHDAVAGEYKAFVSASPPGGNPWHTAVYGAATPLGGPWTLETANLLPAIVQATDAANPENPRVWHSATLGRWVLAANELAASTGHGHGGIWYADTLAHFSATDGSCYHARVASKGTGDAPLDFNFFSPRHSLSLGITSEESDGTVGVIAGTRRTDGGTPGTPHGGFVLAAAQLEPHASCLRFEGAASDLILASTFDLTPPFVVEVTTVCNDSGSLNFLFAMSGSGNTPAGRSGLLVSCSDGASDIALFSLSAGSYSLADSGTGANPAPEFTPDSVNGWHNRIRVAWNGATVVWDVNGTRRTVTPAGTWAGTKLGFGGYHSTDARWMGLKVYSSDSVTFSGLPAGATVALLGAGGLPAAVGTADGSGDLSLSHSHYPLYGVSVNGVAAEIGTGPVWGGDAYTYAAG
jgi:hypothetical protein